MLDYDFPQVFVWVIYSMKIERAEARSKAIKPLKLLIAYGNLYSDCLAPLLTSQSW